MSRRLITVILLAVIVVMVFTACAAQVETPRKSAESYEDFYGKTIGVGIGTISDAVVQERLDAVPAYYSDTSAGIEDVRQGRIDGHMADLSVLNVLISMPGNEDLTYFPLPKEIYSGPMGAISLDQGMIDRFNVFLAELEADGTIAEMQARWLEDVPDLDSPMPDIPLSGENGVLKIAANAAALPFSYVGAGGELKGYSVELALRFAAHEGMGIEFADMEFSAMIPYVVAGKADLGIANISITEERKQSVLFTEPIYYDRLGIAALKQGAVAERAKSAGFIEWFKTGVERNLLEDNRWMMIADGLGVTMVIAVLSQLCGTAVGCFICFLLTRKNRFVSRLGKLYCGLIHGTPVVVLLMITYYIIFGDSGVSNVLIAVAAFTFVTGAGIAGNLKGAINTVDSVEIEAARSVGFSAFQAFLTVTLPQAVCRVLPSYTNGFVELVKATAVVGYIAIQDLTRAGDIIRSRTYDAYFPLLFVAVIYLTVTTVCVWIFKLIVNKVRGGEAL